MWVTPQQHDTGSRKQNPQHRTVADNAANLVDSVSVMFLSWILLPRSRLEKTWRRHTPMQVSTRGVEEHGSRMSRTLTQPWTAGSTSRRQCASSCQMGRTTHEGVRRGAR